MMAVKSGGTAKNDAPDFSMDREKTRGRLRQSRLITVCGTNAEKT